MDGLTAIEDFVGTLKQPPVETNTTYSATVSRVDREGTVWVYLSGSQKETPTASTSTEVKRGDAVTVQWRNNKLYIGGNYSNPSAGVTRVANVEFAAEIANQAAANAVTDAGVARQAAESAQADAVIAKVSADEAKEDASDAGRAASRAQAAAEAAQETADLKKQVFITTPTPPYHVGDMWAKLGEDLIDLIDSSGNNIVDDQNALFQAAILTDAAVYVCTNPKLEGQLFDESDWNLATADTSLREWFWHDALGAHVLGDVTGYRNDLTSTGMKIMDTADESCVAQFGQVSQIGFLQDGSTQPYIEIDNTGFRVSDRNVQDIFWAGRREGLNQSGQKVLAPCIDLGVRDYSTYADIGNFSVAEGYDSKASGYASHTEGMSNVASGIAAHAEGNGTYAVGNLSHAEGFDTRAYGEASHVQGEGTIANYANQTVIGQFNDNSSNNAFEIGNGTDNTSPSNAFVVEWSGDVFADGDITDGAGSVLSNKLDASALADYVISQGTSGDWRYRKWHSGKIEAWYEGTFSCAASTTARGSLYYSTWSLTIPAAIGFTAAPNTLIGNTGNSTTVIAVNGAATSATAMSGNVWRYASSTSALNITARIYAWED